MSSRAAAQQQNQQQSESHTNSARYTRPHNICDVVVVCGLWQRLTKCECASSCVVVCARAVVPSISRHGYSRRPQASRASHPDGFRTQHFVRLRVTCAILPPPASESLLRHGQAPFVCVCVCELCVWYTFDFGEIAKVHVSGLRSRALKFRTSELAVARERIAWL